MYTYDDLKKYDYFKDINMDYALDSLTGVLSRPNILGFAKYLVENKIPFMMGIMDIDNFKLVNDNYGHKVGDECLKSVATNFAKYVGEDGLVGRFGGDEFVVIFFKYTEYDDVHDYVEKMFNEGNIVRRKITVENVSFYVTATIGCASFPKDSQSYDDLFLTVDKALYRGKTKGRNCFIIYVEAKHKNIKVYRKEESSLPNMFIRISELANNSKQSFNKIIKNIMDYVADSLQISEAAYLMVDRSNITSGEGFQCMVDDECLKIFDKLTEQNNFFIPTGIFDLTSNKKIAKFIEEKNILTFCVSRVTIDKRTAGYIILFEGKINRMWQKNDVALLQYLNTVIDLLYIKRKKEF